MRDACQVSAKPRIVRLRPGDFQLSLFGRSTADPLPRMLMVFAGAVLPKLKLEYCSDTNDEPADISMSTDHLAVFNHEE
jgi:hypothetical protein